MRNVILSIILIIISFLFGCDKVSHLKIHIIDVGQGDSILIQTPHNKNILVDGGNEDSDSIVKRYLKKQNVDVVDYLIVTHHDSDHIGGLDNIINNFEVKSIYMPEYKHDSTSYSNLISACSKKNLYINYLYKNDTLHIDNNIILSVLSPSFIQKDSNLNSIVFKLSYLDKSFLFTGDAEEPNEIDIINSFDISDIDFLKVGHHGSSSSTSDMFLDEINPDIAVISCGYKNQYGHPHRNILENLSNKNTLVYRTDILGDIVFYSDGDIIYTKNNYEYNTHK